MVKHRQYKKHSRPTHPHHHVRRAHHRSLTWLYAFGVLFVLLVIGFFKYAPQSWFSRAQKETDFVGELQVTVADDFTQGKSVTKHYLKTKNERLELSNISPSKKVGGTKVTVRGKKSSEGVVEVVAVSELAPAMVSATGSKNIAVVLVDFTDVTNTNLTALQAQTHINSDFRAFYLENSFSKLSLSGTAFGTFALSIPFTCDIWRIQEEAVRAADSAVNFSQYQALMIVMPDNSHTCGFAGVATLGPVTMTTDDGAVTMPITWFTSQDFSIRATVHEFAHGFGVYHANGWNCGTSVVGGSCESAPYSDPWDPMGAYRGGDHFNMHHKEYLGWVPLANIQTITRTGKYKLAPLEKASLSPQVYKISKRDGTFYYIYQRVGFGFDADLPTNVTAGVQISWGPSIINSGDTHLVDMTPNSASPEMFADFLDGGLGANQTFSDGPLGIKVKVASKRADIVTLDVIIPR